MSASLRFTRRRKLYKVWKSFIDNKGHDAQCFPNLVIHRAVPGTVDFSLKIEPSNVNRVGTVHGGLILSLTDTLGSLAVASKGHYMTAFRPILAHHLYDLQAGQAIPSMHEPHLLPWTFTNPAGDLVAYGYHTKYVGKSSSDPNNVKFSEDGEQVIEGNDVD
ncbi:thioesterase thiol ester dehydrase-isomerase [Suillus cothurnatus]|nr:thioesterase thiol ester dehydrase-isomerase [Suillus cothurnatus]